jgi:hypothetical protein
VQVVLDLTVQVDPEDEQLLEIVRRSRRPLTIPDVVRCEVESNLESVPYVRRVSIT